MDELTQDVRRDAIGASRRTERPVKRLLGLTLGALVLIALAVGGTLYWLNARDFETTDDAAVDAYTTQMASRVAGQVLLQIDPRDYQAKVDQARAQQASAEAMLQQARAQVAVQQAAVDQAAANVHVAEAGLVQARQDYERYQKINPNAVTRQQVEAATATFHADQAKLEASRQTVGGAQATLQAAQAQVLAAQASLKQAEANTRAAELQLSYCAIIAPVSGMVTHRTVSDGPACP
jgi:membrane fusion protein (multidrug efflux system)